MCLESAHYRPQEGRWTLIVLLTRIPNFLVIVDLRFSGWKACGQVGSSVVQAGPRGTTNLKNGSEIFLPPPPWWGGCGFN